MKLSSIFFAAASAAGTAQAATAYSNSGTEAIQNLQARSEQCSEVTHFIDETSDNSPRRDQCEELLQWLKDHKTPSYAHLDRGGWIELWSGEGSGCTFGARRLDTGDIVRVDRVKARELLEKALDEGYGKDDKIGIRGEMKCSSIRGNEKTQFSISSTKDW